MLPLHPFCVAIILFLTFFDSRIVESRENPNVSNYLLRLQQLRQAAAESNSAKTPTSKSDKTSAIGSGGTAQPKKVKRYKCVLVEDEDGELDGEGRIITGDGSALPLFPSFAAEVKKSVDKEAGGMDGDFSTPVPYAKSLNISKMSKVSRPSGPLQPQESINSIDDIPSSFTNARTAAATPNRMPTAQGIPLKNAPTYKANVADERLRHVGTPTRRIPNPSTTSSPTLPAVGSNMTLDPEHCKAIIYYASLYNVKDVKGWVHHNCAFAKMYLPNATCEEIDMLVATCF